MDLCTGAYTWVIVLSSNKCQPCAMQITDFSFRVARRPPRMRCHDKRVHQHNRTGWWEPENDYMCSRLFGAGSTVGGGPGGKQFLCVLISQETCGFAWAVSTSCKGTHLSGALCNLFFSHGWILDLKDWTDELCSNWRFIVILLTSKSVVVEISVWRDSNGNMGYLYQPKLLPICPWELHLGCLYRYVLSYRKSTHLLSETGVSWVLAKKDLTMTCEREKGWCTTQYINLPPHEL